MGQAGTPISCTHKFKIELINFRYGSGGLVNSGHLRDIYTNGFLDTLRTPKKPMTAMERCRSVCKSKRDKNDFYIKTQAFSTIKQQQASSTFRKYQMKK